MRDASWIGFGMRKIDCDHVVQALLQGREVTKEVSGRTNRPI
jgi:hypothetical protein